MLTYSSPMGAMPSQIHSTACSKGTTGFCGGERGFDIVDVERIVAQQLLAQAPVAVPGGQVLLEDLDQVVENFHRDIVGSQRGVQGGGIAARPGVEHILLDGGGQGGGEGVLEVQVAIGVVLPGGAAHLPVGVGDQGSDAGLTDLQLGAIAGLRRLEGQLGVVEGVIDGCGGEEWVIGHRQHLLHLTGAHMGLAFLQPVDVVGEESQPRLVS